jgi:hypothetical protein
VPHDCKGHAPQSFEQLEHVSDPLHVPSPHAGGQVPQSFEQLEHVSDPLHVPSPHAGGHVPQSFEQLEQVSVPVQFPSPQEGQAPQSCGQFVHDSPAPHSPLGQVAGHAPQSFAQLEHVSVPLHVPSPHDGAHAAQVITPLQPSEITPQSDALQVLAAHVPWPQRFGPAPPQVSSLLHGPHDSTPPQPSGAVPHSTPVAVQVIGWHGPTFPSVSPPLSPGAS